MEEEEDETVEEEKGEVARGRGGSIQIQITLLASRRLGLPGRLTSASSSTSKSPMVYYSSCRPASDYHLSSRPTKS